MILKDLADYYDVLAKRDKISSVGWSKARVSFGLVLDEEGNIVNIYSLKERPEGGKKELPVTITVPEQIKKSSNVASNFLCESSSYLLGVGKQGVDKRTIKCFEAAKRIHHDILAPYTYDPDVKSLLLFFEKWNPEAANDHEILKDYLDEIIKDANLIFISRDGIQMHRKKIMIDAWENYREGLSLNDNSRGICLVTGKIAPIARLHPSIKGVMGAQSSGASLVSFNADAFESYGHGQGLNSPTSELAAFKYTTALNYLLAEKDHAKRLSDMTLTYWSEDGDSALQDFTDDLLFGEGDEISTDRLNEIAEKIKNGEPVPYHNSSFTGDTRFFVLGLAPNAARLAVNFYEENSFGHFLKNLVMHYNDLDIVRPVFAQDQKNSIWQLLYEMSNKNSREKKVPSPIISSLLYAVLNGTQYPDIVFNHVLMRIHAEHDVNWRKAAMIKAYLIRAERNKKDKKMEEVLSVELNKDSDYIPYVLGREFALLERIQQEANPDIKATIKDRYFTSASATPAPIFAILLKLTQHHIRKLPLSPEKGKRSRLWAEKCIGELENRIHEPIPSRLNLQEQGIFYLGYYHQRQEFFKKNEKEEAENE